MQVAGLVIMLDELTMRLVHGEQLRMLERWIQAVGCKAQAFGALAAASGTKKASHVASKTGELDSSSWLQGSGGRSTGGASGTPARLAHVGGCELGELAL
jgi:hypothetical protein